MKAKRCTVIVNTRMGHCCVPYVAESIRKGVEWAKESGGFAYRVFVDGKIVRRGFCND